MSDLEQQWEEDVKQFGELAYLMWEILSTRGNGNQFYWQSPLSNNCIPCDMRRKKSAALPFDLVAANAGDKVEWFDGKQWSDFKIRKYGLVQQNMLTFYKYHSMDFRSIDIGYLRMKHPRRVGVDYSRFEEK